MIKIRNITSLPICDSEMFCLATRRVEAKWYSPIFSETFDKNEMTGNNSIIKVCEYDTFVALLFSDISSSCVHKSPLPMDF